MASYQDCRMYEAKFPEVDDIVIVEVDKIAEMGAYVRLLEYNRIEGMILLSELSRRRIRSINKLIKVSDRARALDAQSMLPSNMVRPLSRSGDKKQSWSCELTRTRATLTCPNGKMLPLPLPVASTSCQVKLWLLLLRRVSQEDAAKAEERFSKSKMDLYQKVAWTLYRIYGHAFEAMKTMVADDGVGIFKKLEEVHEGPLEVLTPEVKEALLKNIKRRMTPQPVKIRADVELTCFQYDGIEHIKASMRAAEAQSTEARMKGRRRAWGPVWNWGLVGGVAGQCDACLSCQASASGGECHAGCSVTSCWEELGSNCCSKQQQVGRQGPRGSSGPCPTACLSQECVVKMKLVAPPLYVLTTQTLDKSKGVEIVASGQLPQLCHTRPSFASRACPVSITCVSLRLCQLYGPSAALCITAKASPASPPVSCRASASQPLSAPLYPHASSPFTCTACIGCCCRHYSMAPSPAPMQHLGT
ncbi:S1 motif domain-containing protein [Haematococcus lacustris]|uniref:S1 motif domain-containing protein n=1 Tax=Haematococcus lacustris TaxID=44745 RepID=A0A699ZJB6_HAELA|nr:S1 motif domain-containing protein [Haematococcus lacustris]